MSAEGEQNDETLIVDENEYEDALPALREPQSPPTRSYDDSNSYQSRNGLSSFEQSAHALFDDDTILDSQIEGNEQRDLFQSLFTCWINEVNAPELLDYPLDIIQSVRSIMTTQRERVEAMIEAAQNPDSTPSDSLDVLNQNNQSNHWEVSLYELELDRLTYVLNDLHRIRLAKIEQFGFDLLSSVRVDMILHPFERQFAQKFVDLWGNHLQESLLNKFNAPHLRELNLDRTPQAIPKPKLDSHVFVRINGHSGEMLGELDIPNEDPMELIGGDIWVTQWNAVHQLVKDDRAILL